MNKFINPVVAAFFVFTIFLIGLAGYLFMQFVNPNSFIGFVMAFCMPCAVLTSYYLKVRLFSGQG